jgi:hypothetical protein
VALLASTLAHAERVDVGDYFSFDRPSSWEVTDGDRLHGEGSYTIYKAIGRAVGMVITIRNNDPKAFTPETYFSLNEADLYMLAVHNQKVGWSLPVVWRDVTKRGVPGLFFRDKQGDLRELDMHFWVGNQPFVISFRYLMNPATVKTINGVIDSIQVNGSNISWASF